MDHLEEFFVGHDPVDDFSVLRRLFTLNNLILWTRIRRDVISEEASKDVDEFAISENIRAHEEMKKLTKA